MLIIGSPPDPENYLATDKHFASALQQMGMHPKYREGRTTYFKRTAELEEAIKKIVSNL